MIVLAGDIDAELHGAEWMIGEADRLGKPVVYVLGNHEFYGKEYFALKQAIGARLKNTGVHLLDCGCFEKDGVSILGATLWMDYRLDGHIPGDLAIAYAARQLAGHRMIHYKPADTCLRFQPLYGLALHYSERHWLNARLRQPYPGKTVVVSHHAPHPVCSHPNFPNSVLARPSVRTWKTCWRPMLSIYGCTGHAHANLDRLVQGTVLWLIRRGIRQWVWRGLMRGLWWRSEGWLESKIRAKNMFANSGICCSLWRRFPEPSSGWVC